MLHNTPMIQWCKSPGYSFLGENLSSHMVTVNPNSLSGNHTAEQSNRKITLLILYCPPSHFQLFSGRLPVMDFTGRPLWDLSAADIQGREPLFHPQWFQERSWHLYTRLPWERGQTKSSTRDKLRWAGGDCLGLASPALLLCVFRKTQQLQWTTAVSKNG